MVSYEDNCVGCPPEMGCLGSTCPNRNVPIYICDECEEEVYDLYKFDDGRELCQDCLLAQFKKVGD